MVSRKELKRRARLQLGGSIFSGKWMVALLVCLVAELILNLLNLPSIISGGRSVIQALQVFLTTVFSDPNEAGVLPSGLSFRISVFGGVGAVIMLLIAGPVNYGLNKMFLKQARDQQDMVFTDLFKGFTEDLGTNILIGLMTAVFTFLWGLLFVIPGIVKAFAYSMAFYVKADHPDYSWNACISESKRLMKGNKGKLFWLDLSFIGWYFVGALCFGVGTLWVTPYMEAARAHFYQTIAYAETPAAPFGNPQPPFAD